MIVIAGSVAIKPDRRAEAVQVAREMAEATRREAGCVAYDFYSGLHDPNVFFLFEEWATEDALVRHFETEHTAAFQRRLPDLLASRPTLKRYVVSSSSVVVLGRTADETDRGPLLTFLVLLFGLLAVSDLTKPLQEAFGAGLRPGFVLFGHRLSGTANAVAGPLFGLYLLVYAAGIWRMRRWALPVGAVYAAYVVVNLILFMVRDPEPMREGVLFGVIYAVVAIGISWGAVWVLSQRRDVLT